MKILAPGSVPSKVEFLCFHIHLPCGERYKNINRFNRREENSSNFFIRHGAPAQIYIKRKINNENIIN